MDPNSTPFVSIVVPAREEARNIGECLRRLTAQDYPEDRLEVIVADGGSLDDTAARVRSAAASDHRIILVTNPDRVTPAAFNIGIRAARGEIIGVMSAHAAPADDYLRRGVADLAATGAWCVGGRIARAGETSLQRAIAAATSSPFGVGNAVHNYSTEARWVETAFPGLWPRWVFERVGLFDRELERNQDDELSFRIRKAGGRIWYDPAIEITYQPRSSIRGVFSQYRQYGMWKVRVYQKHPGAVRPRQLVPAAFVGAVVGGWALAPFTLAGPLVSLTALAGYLLLVILAAVRIGGNGIARRAVVASLCAVHLGYGIGFWQGLVRFAPRWIWHRRRAPEPLVQRVEN